MNSQPPATPNPPPTLACLLGRGMQAVVLALAIALIIMLLVRSGSELTFRYGGF